MTTFKTHKTLEQNWNTVAKELKSLAQRAYEVDIEKVMENVLDRINKKRYKVQYSDNHTVHIKVDRRKNSSIISTDIRSIVEEEVGSKEVSEYLFKYRMFDGMITIERRR